MGLGNRIWTAATIPVVRNLGPALSNVFKTFVQFVVIMAAGCALLVAVYFMGQQGIPERVIKSAAIFLGLIPMGFALLVVGEQVRLTYTKPKEIVYPDVEAFPDREPT
jgi:hypothetical protein